MDEQSLQARIRVAETMLETYIRERRKALAEMALATLMELAPGHRRRADYRAWIDEIDREAAADARMHALVAAARTAFREGDLPRARRRLAALRKLDPDDEGAASLTAEIARAEQEQRRGNDVDRSKKRIDDLLAAGRVDEAEREIELLADQGVAKLTRYLLSRRLAATRSARVERDRIEQGTQAVAEHLAAGRWQEARDVARQLGGAAPSAAGDLFERVNRAEAAHRRAEAVDQGISALERFIAQGRRSEAKMTLDVLRGLDVDERQIRFFDQRIARL